MGRYDGNNIEEVAARTMALFYLFDKSGKKFMPQCKITNHS